MSVYKDVKKEEKRQVEQWGIQNHPCLDELLLKRKGGCTPQRMTEHYEIPSEDRARQLCERSFEKGEGTYAHIALEEFSEVVSEFDDEKRRVELVQLAAVCVSWIKALDRRNKDECVCKVPYGKHVGDVYKCMACKKQITRKV